MGEDDGTTHKASKAVTDIERRSVEENTHLRHEIR